MNDRYKVAQLIHDAYTGDAPGPSDPPVLSHNFPERERARYLRIADAILEWQRQQLEAQPEPVADMEVLRLRVAMAKAAQRAEDWPDSNDDPADVLADCINILYAAMDSAAADRADMEGEV